MQKTTASRRRTPTAETETSAQGFTRRIGRTTYKIAVHFNPDSKETVNDKIIRMIKNEVAGKAAGQ